MTDTDTNTWEEALIADLRAHGGPHDQRPLRRRPACLLAIYLGVRLTG